MFKKHWLTISFICIELILWISILFNLIHLPSGVIHYFSVIVCGIYLLISYKNDVDHKIMLFVFGFILIADYFLTLRQTEQALGTLFFFLVQVMVLFRLKHNFFTSFKYYLPYLIIFIVLSISVWLGLGTFDVLLLIGTTYMTLLILNMAYAWIFVHKIKLLAIGLTFQLLADIFVAINMSSPYIKFETGSLLYILDNIDFNLIWFFYLPALVFMALSIEFNHLYKGEKHV